MIGGADENEPEDQPSTPSPPPPPPPPLPPPIASPSSPLQRTAGVGLGRRLFGSIRSLLPASPRAAAPAPKLGLGLLLHLRPDHPSLHPTSTPPASASPSASEDDPLEEDAAAARPHAAARRGDGGLDAAAGLHSMAHTGGDVALEGDQEAGLVDGQQVAAPAAKEFRAGDESRPTDVASPSASEEDEARATGVSSASEDDDPEEGGSLDAAEWLRAAKQAPHLLQYLRPAAETGGELAMEEDQEGGLALVDGHGQEGTIHTQAAAPAKGDDQFCASDESGASEEKDLVGEKEKVVEQQGVADRQGTLVKDVDSAGDDQDKVLQQCTGDQLRAASDDQEVGEQDAIHPRDETTCDIAATDDQEKVGLAENVDVVEGQEVVEQDGIHPRDATTYYIAVEEQEKVEGHGTNQCGSTGNNDDAVEDQEVLLPDVIDRKGEGTDGTAVDDQDKAVQQCDTYELGTTENDDDDAEDDQEAVEQGVCDEGRMDDDNAVKDHEAAGQSVIDIMRTTIDATAVEDQEKGVDATYDLGTVENDDVMDVQEVVEQDTTHPMDDIAVEEEEKLERHATHGLGSTENVDDAVEDQEVLLPDVIDRKGEGTDGTAVDDQDKAVQQCDTYELGTTENDDDDAEDDQEAVEQGVCDEEGVDDDNAVKDHEAAGQSVIDRMHTTIDAIAVEDQEKGVDATYDLGTVENDDVMDDQEVVKQDTTHPMDDIAFEKEEKLERHATHGLGSTENIDDSVEDQEAVEQCVIDRKDESTDGTAVDDQEKALEQCSAYGLGTTENDDAKDDQEVLEVVSATANGSDGDIGKKEKVKLTYPQRPGKLNCPFYMSKGSCSYGLSCNFHHPRLKAKPGCSWRSSEQGNQGVAEILELNHIGLPIREGARNCTYYMRNGACRYGKHCHFNHPEHVIDAQFYAPTGWEDSALQSEKSFDHHTTVDDTSHLKKSSDDATLDDTSSSTGVLPPNILRMLLPPQKVPATTEAKVIPVKKDSNWSSTSDDSDGCCSADSSDGPLCKQENVDSSDWSLCKQQHVDYPERPGRPECPFYMRFGDCKFASRCKYHHTIDKCPTRYHPEIPSLGGEQTEYPERPGEPECPFYMKAQFCKFGAQCKFNHPKDSNPTLQGPMNAKKSVAANEHQPTRITPEDHMPQQQQHPERPGEPDCRYYLQFGECKFLSACIFHHPRDALPSGPAHSDQIEPDIHGMPECPFYMKSGKCQFGSACEVRHPKDVCSTTEGAFGHRTGSAYDNFTRPGNVVQQREQTMYPERPGEPECFQYMRHGSCRFQMNCRYHHPADRLSRKQYDSTYH